MKKTQIGAILAVSAVDNSLPHGRLMYITMFSIDAEAVAATDATIDAFMIV